MPQLWLNTRTRSSPRKVPKHAGFRHRTWLELWAGTRHGRGRIVSVSTENHRIVSKSTGEQRQFMSKSTRKEPYHGKILKKQALETRSSTELWVSARAGAGEMWVLSRKRLQLWVFPRGNIELWVNPREYYAQMWVFSRKKIPIMSGPTD